MSSVWQLVEIVTILMIATFRDVMLNVWGLLERDAYLIVDF